MNKSFLDIISKLSQDSPEKKFLTFNSTHFTRKSFLILTEKTIQVLNRSLYQSNSSVIYHGSNDIVIPLLIIAAQQLDFKLILLPPSISENNVFEIAKQSSAQLLLCENNHDKKFMGKQIITSSFLEAVLNEHLETRVVPNNSNRFFRLMFLTSGTTGAPKLIALKKEHLLANISAAIIGQKITVDDISLSFLTLCQSGGCCIQFLPSFFVGSEIVVSNNQSLQRFIELTKLHQPTITLIVPFLLKQLIQNNQYKSIIDLLKRYRLVGIGSTALDDELIHSLAEMNIKFCNIYGLTEAGPFAFFKIIENDTEKNPISIGSPAEGISYQLTQDNELLLKGPQVQPEQYSGSNLSSLLDENNWFHTGDYFKVKNHELYFSHRKHEVLQISGHKVLLNRIEKIILTMPGVENCLVIGHEIKNHSQIHLYVQKKQNSDLTIEDLKSFCKKYLNRHEIPRRIFFVDEIPKSSIGKNLRKRLLDI